MITITLPRVPLFIHPWSVKTTYITDKMCGISIISARNIFYQLILEDLKIKSTAVSLYARVLNI